MNVSAEARPPVPPFTRWTALDTIRTAKDAWNSRHPARMDRAPPITQASVTWASMAASTR